MCGIKFLLILTFIGLLAAINASATAPQTRITSGTATHISRFPFEVSVRRRLCEACPYEHYCSGIIYKADIIITTANCVKGVSPVRTLIVAGTSWRQGAANDGHIYPVREILLHADIRADIAIVRLAVPIMLNGVTTKVGTLAKELPAAGTMGTVAGWGQQQEFEPYSETLNEVRVPIIEHQACKNFYYWTEVTEYELCAGYEQGGSDTCKGDAGSPLVVNHEIVGLVAWGYGCARPNYPGVYTNLVHLKEWIEEKV